VKEQLQHAVRRLIDWSRENDMVLNASKTKVMLFGNTNAEIKLIVDGAVIEQMKSYKYLRVLLDTALDFCTQVDYVVHHHHHHHHHIFFIKQLTDATHYKK